MHSPAQNGAVAAALQSVAITPSQPAVAIGSTTQLKAHRNLQRWFDQRRHHGLCVDCLQTRAPSGQVLPACCQGWPPERRPSPAAIRDTRPRSRPPAPSARWSGAVQSSSPRPAPTPGTGRAPISKTPAVTVATTAPVVIENSHIRSVGELDQDRDCRRRSDRPQQSRPWP